MIVRAGVDDRAMVSALGINIQLVFAGAFFVGSFLAGFGGVLGGTMISLDKGNDTAFLLNSLIVVIIGGMGSLGGAAIGALALGLVDAFSDIYLPARVVELLDPLDLRPSDRGPGGATARPLRSSGVRLERPQLLRLGVAAAVLLILFLAPLIFTNYQYGVLGTKILWLGIVAASLIFLAGYGGMVSLAQTALFGIAGFVVANLVVFTGWSEWPAVAVGILIATSVGLLFGLIASRSVGIYFLMITLAFAVIVFYFFGQVTKFSGFGGVNNVSAPDLIGNPRQDPAPLYYAALIVSVLVYFGIRYLVRTPFGLALQGVRDEPTRMRALGFNVHLHRTLAFGVGSLHRIVGWRAFGLVQLADFSGLDRRLADDRRARDRRRRRPLPSRGRLDRRSRLHRPRRPAPRRDDAFQHGDRDRLPRHRAAVAGRARRHLGPRDRGRTQDHPDPFRRERRAAAGRPG